MKSFRFHFLCIYLMYVLFFLHFISFICSAASCDVGFAIYSRYESEPFTSSVPSVSFVAHIAGACAGLTIGLIVLKNFEQKLHENLLWWIALGIYCACIIFAVIFNLVNGDAEYAITSDGSDSVTILKFDSNY